MSAAEGLDAAARRRTGWLDAARTCGVGLPNRQLLGRSHIRRVGRWTGWRQGQARRPVAAGARVADEAVHAANCPTSPVRLAVRGRGAVGSMHSFVRYASTRCDWASCLTLTPSCPPTYSPNMGTSKKLTIG